MGRKSGCGTGTGGNRVKSQVIAVDNWDVVSPGSLQERPIFLALLVCLEQTKQALVAGKHPQVDRGSCWFTNCPQVTSRQAEGRTDRTSKGVLSHYALPHRGKHPKMSQGKLRNSSSENRLPRSTSRTGNTPMDYFSLCFLSVASLGTEMRNKKVFSRMLSENFSDV